MMSGNGTAISIAMSSMSGDMNNADYAASLICFLPTDKHAKMICVVMYFPFINKSLIIN